MFLGLNEIWVLSCNDLADLLNIMLLIQKTDTVIHVRFGEPGYQTGPGITYDYEWIKLDYANG
jgi:hypothetical protein